MSAETARSGWNDSLLLDRLTHGTGLVHRSPVNRSLSSGEPYRCTESVQQPSAPQLHPLPVPVVCPSPLSLPDAMSQRSPLKLITDCFARPPCFCKDLNCPTTSSSPSDISPASTRAKSNRSALAELKSTTNLLDSSPATKFSSLKIVRKSPSPNRPSSSSQKSLSPSLCKPRSLFRTKSGKRSFSEVRTPRAAEGKGHIDENAVDIKENVLAPPLQILVVSPFKRKRPPKLQIPLDPDTVQQQQQQQQQQQHQQQKPKDVPVEVTAEGKYYGMYSKKGSREVLEDTYQAVPEIGGKSHQALFGIFDGHGGRKAAEFAADNLLQNIRTALAKSSEEGELEEAVKVGYRTTDAAFLEKQVSSGASCVTALVKDDVLVVANAGDCRAVLSKSGIAVALTKDHRLAREDERQRVENLGGFVDCYSGVWRLQGVLAVSRGIGDMHLKEWVSAEPEVITLSISTDCEFLILASDGLWDVVNNQEAVDCVKGEMRLLGESSPHVTGLASSCKKLVQLAAGRGTHDDISVMIVNLRHFCRSFYQQS